MTDIKELLERINSNPVCIEEIDLKTWREETDWFAKDRLREIVMGIKDEDVCLLFCDCIAEVWYIACEDAFTDSVNPKRNLGNSQPWLRYRFNPYKDFHSLKYEKIEDFLTGLMETKMRKYMRKKRFEEKHSLSTILPQSPLGEVTLVDKLNEKIRQLEENKIELETQLSRLMNSVPQSQTVDENSIFRNFLESIIEYAENFPSNQNDKADVIKGMLMAKGFNGQIPNEALTSEMRARIVNLGRKETPMPAMFNVTGNEEVNIGAK